MRQRKVQNADMMRRKHVSIGFAGRKIAEGSAQVEKGTFGPVTFVEPLHFKIDDAAVV